MTIEDKIKRYIKKSQAFGKVIETRKVEFKESYPLFSGRTINKDVKAELIRDTMSLVNSQADPEEETGLLIIGVKQNGEIVDNYESPVDDVSKWEEIINPFLERRIVFSYRDFEIDSKKFGCLIVPRSISRPHIVKIDFKKDEKYLLRKGECWTRSDGMKRVALASDYQEMFEEVKRDQSVESGEKKKELAKVSTRKKKKGAELTPAKILSIDSNEFIKLSKRLMR